MIFEFYWSWYEDYQPYLFEHKNKSEAIFIEDCKRAMKECFEEFLIKKGDMWAGMGDWAEFACKKLEDYGYIRIKPKRFGYWGGYIVEEIEDVEFCKDFPAECKKMIEHNKKVKEETDA